MLSRAILGLILGLACLPHASAGEQGENMLKTDILAVFAHPDDETGMAATLAHYAWGRSARIAHVYCTRGEGGGNMVGTHAGPALGALREAELQQCLQRLGVRHVRFLDQLDWAYTESAAATLEKWGLEISLERLVRLIRLFRPEIILTMNPAPTPGQHGHHQAAGILATEAFDAAADASRFSLQLSKEGLRPWQPRRLFYSGAGEPGVTLEVTHRLPNELTPAQIAGNALSQHRSQGFGAMVNAPWLQRPQRFALVKTWVPSEELRDDLLQGLPAADSLLHSKHALAQPPAPSFDFQFVPRPAFQRYQAWTRRHRLEHWTQRYQADLPVIEGTPSEVKISVSHPWPQPLRGTLEMKVPSGWQVRPRSSNLTLPAGQKQTASFQVIAPPGTTADATLTASWSSAEWSTNVSAIAHPVPSARVPKHRRPLSIDLDPEPAFQTARLAITSKQLAQGKTDGEADSSSRVRLAHDGRRLWIDVEVTDDVVVTNIAPNDIRGHWRTDSVEVCLDPRPGSEHTLGCYKLGIFPFDLTGRVRAARDADASQGPVEETAPETRIASSRTPNGYRVRAVIPFSEIGLKKGQKELGFNIIIYDGDKRDAAVGENINESRIAWAPRPGVMGRPEDWGRLALE